MSLQEYLTYIINEVPNVPYKDKKGGEYKFILADLFKGYVWKNIPLKDRITLGTMFYDWAKNEGKDVVCPLEGINAKTAQGQQLYIKKWSL